MSTLASNDRLQRLRETYARMQAEGRIGSPAAPPDGATAPAAAPTESPASSRQDRLRATLYRLYPEREQQDRMRAETMAPQTPATPLSPKQAMYRDRGIQSPPPGDPRFQGMIGGGLESSPTPLGTLGDFGTEWDRAIMGLGSQAVGLAGAGLALNPSTAPIADAFQKQIAKPFAEATAARQAGTFGPTRDSILGMAGGTAPQMVTATGAGMLTGGLGLPATLGAFGLTSAAPALGQSFQDASVAGQSAPMAALEALGAGGITAATSLFPGAAIFSRYIPGGNRIVQELGRNIATRLGAAATGEIVQEATEGGLQEALAIVTRQGRLPTGEEWGGIIARATDPKQAIVAGAMGAGARGGVETARPPAPGGSPVRNYSPATAAAPQTVAPSAPSPAPAPSASEIATLIGSPIAGDATSTRLSPEAQAAGASPQSIPDPTGAGVAPPGAGISPGTPPPVSSPPSPADLSVDANNMVAPDLSPLTDKQLRAVARTVKVRDRGTREQLIQAISGADQQGVVEAVAGLQGAQTASVSSDPESRTSQPASAIPALTPEGRNPTAESQPEGDPRPLQGLSKYPAPARRDDADATIGLGAYEDSSREAWQLTRSQFAKVSRATPIKGAGRTRADQAWVFGPSMDDRGTPINYGELVNTPAKARDYAHRLRVEQALASGKPVPPEVLADYPDLAAQALPQRPQDAPQTPPTDVPDFLADIQRDEEEARRGAQNPQGRAEARVPAKERRPSEKEWTRDDALSRAESKTRIDLGEHGAVWDGRGNAFGGDGEMEDLSFSFPGKLPGEIRSALEGRFHLAKYFRANTKSSSSTGADTLGRMGADWMIEQAEKMHRSNRSGDRGEEQVRADLKWYVGSGDPEAVVASVILETDPGFDTQPQPRSIIDNPQESMEPGDRFSLMGREFIIEESKDGPVAVENTKPRMVDDLMGGMVEEKPKPTRIILAGLETLPIDRGSFRRGAAKPKPGESVKAWAERVKQAAQERQAARARETAELRRRAKPGERIGAAPVIGDIVDKAIEIAMDAIATGITAGRELGDFTRQRLPKNMASDWRRVIHIVKGIVADAKGEDGTLDPERAGASVAELEAAYAGRRPRKPRADDPQSVVAARQVSRRSYADGVAAMRPRMDELRERIRETRKGERSRAAEKQRTVVAKLEARRAAGDAKAAAALEKAKGKFTALADANRVAQGIRREIVNLVRENVPSAYQGRFLSTVRDAKTIDALADALESINATIAKDRGRTQLARVRKMTGKKRLARVLDDQVLKDIKAARDKAERGAADLKAAIERGDSDQAMNHADGMKAQADIIAENLAHAKALYQITVRGEIVRTAKVQAEVKANAEKRTKLRSIAPDGTAKEIDAKWVVRTFRRQLTLKNLARIMDGSFSQQGPVQKVFADLFDASNARDARLVQMHDAADAAMRRAGFASSMEAAAVISGTLGRGARRTVNVSIPGITRRLTLGQALSIYARDPETKNRWTKGQPAILETAKGSKAFILDQKKREEIEAAIPENLRRLVVDLKAIKDELFPDLDKAHRTLKGIRLQRVDDHWPIRLDRSDKATYAEGYRAMAQQHLENAGYLQEREGASKAPIKIGDFLEEFFNHMESAVAIAHMAVPIRNAEVVMGARDVRESIARTLGESANSRIAEILQDASGLSSYGPQSKIGQASDRITRTVASNVSKAYTKINPRSWLRQLGGVMMLRARLDNQDWAAGVRNVADKGMTERMSRATHVRVRYMQNYAMRASQADTSPSIESAPRKGDARRALNAIAENAKVASFPGAWKALGAAIDTVRIADWFDKIPVRVAWAALENQAKREHPEWSAEQTQKWVEAEHRELIRDTQNTSGSMDGTGLNAMAARATIMRPFLAFTSDRMKALNLLIEAANSGDKAQIAKASEALLENMAWSAAVSSVTGKRGVMLAGAAVAGMLGMGWDWPEEDEADGFGETFVRSMGKDALGFVPLLGDAVNNLFDPMGTALDNPTSGTINDLKSAFQEFVRAVELTTDAEKRDRAKIGPLARVGRGVEKAALAGATLSGIPVAPGYRIIKNFVQGMLKESGGSDDTAPVYIPYVRVGQATDSGSRARSLPMDSAGSMGPR